MTSFEPLSSETNPLIMVGLIFAMDEFHFSRATSKLAGRCCFVTSSDFQVSPREMSNQWH